ncbi:DELTA-thalatoxin-Avl1a [Xenopus laevis]|uniref:DELTA-thalatoxin-Avl1a n=2 Tax=Xenopus laevis TaxID=8355 RepID=A0A1L8ERF0_XENLA|nr:DELTA-thalatoxin-Avl1a [Xenopus laevis]XP_041434767.1 DELTA-thalatoxin-Avl1a [Xenopus laevis]OCT61917.1 hypothetical protein XELAEV_18047950mg [Xenopus laevis]
MTMQMPMVELLSKVDSGRCVGIEIANKTRSITLSSPSTYCESGYSHSPPPPSISPGTVDRCIFVKTPSTTCGSVGVVTYCLSNSQTVAILFSNPYDYTLYSIYFGVLITDHSPKADYELYNEMYCNKVQSSQFKRARVSKNSRDLEVSHGQVKVLATMSNDTKSILRVEIVDA